MIEREFKRTAFAFKANKVAEDGTFAGYASVFGNVDSYGEIVEKGAFAESIERIKKSGEPLPVLWQHSSWEPIGGSDVLEEDDTGLKTEGFLVLDIPQAKAAHAAMKRRIVKGLSIGYYVEKSDTNEKTGIRSLQKLDLVEYSIVTFPANGLAQIDSVKSILRDGSLPTLKAFEGFLRDAGFSRAQATAVAGGGLKQLLRQSDSDGDTARAVDILSTWKL